MVKKNPDFRFNRKRKSGKTEFFEVHIERALITHLITVLFATFGVCHEILTRFIHPKWLHKFKVNGRAILKRLFKRADPAYVSKRRKSILGVDYELGRILTRAS